MKFHRFLSQEEIEEEVSKAMVPHVKRFVFKVVLLLLVCVITKLIYGFQ